MEGVAGSENLVRYEAAIAKIDQHVERAKKITYRLLGFARRMEPAHEMVDINKTIDETIDFLENDARYKNIDIQANYFDSLPRTKSDSAQLQQIFLNILNNAIDAIQKDGEITIKTTYNPKDEEIDIAFKDNGPGIPREEIKKIFDPFFTTKKMAQGNRLGLSISYGIIEKLGGRITVESEEEQGTTFTVYLPVERE